MYTLTFEQWERAVSRIVEQKVGLPADMLPDWDYRQGFDSGMSTLEAAEAVIENALWA